MKPPRPRFRALWVALAAIAGMLSAADAASACAVAPRSSAARSCCAGRPSPSACCCEAAAKTPAESMAATPAPACPCRVQTPATPADDPSRPNAEIRGGPARLPAGFASAADLPVRPTASRTTPPVDPPPGRRVFYLLFGHLLF